MRKLLATLMLTATAFAGMGTPAHADTTVATAWLHPSEYVPMHNGALKVGVSDAQFQKQSVQAVSFIFGIAGITDAPTTAPGGGNHTISTTYTPTELQNLDHVAGVLHLSRPNAQKTSASIVAFLLALS